MDKEKPSRIAVAFPNGESNDDCAERMKAFLKELMAHYDGTQVMIIGHRATQYSLEHWLKNVRLQAAITAPWSWRPGWQYQLNRMPD